MEVFFSSHVSLFSTAFQLYFSGSQDGDTSELWSCGPTKITRVRKWYHSWYVTSYSTVLYVLCVTLGKLACSESKAIQWHTFNSITASLVFCFFLRVGVLDFLFFFCRERSESGFVARIHTSCWSREGRGAAQKWTGAQDWTSQGGRSRSSHLQKGTPIILD